MIYRLKLKLFKINFNKLLIHFRFNKYNFVNYNLFYGRFFHHDIIHHHRILDFENYPKMGFSLFA